MNVALRDFLDLYNFRRFYGNGNEEIGIRTVRIYYNQPIVNSDERNWFEFGFNDYLAGTEYTPVEVINKNILDQAVKCITVVDDDRYGSYLRIDVAKLYDFGLEMDDEENEETLEKLKKSIDNTKVSIIPLSKTEPCSLLLTEKQIMFLKGLKDKWTYILKDSEYKSTIISEYEPYRESKDDAWEYGIDVAYTSINGLIDDLPLKEDRVYIIEDLIKGTYDNELLFNKGE